jgi:hypothetical protein
MIGFALENNLIPGECFSKKGSNCINAVMTKIFTCNESRIHHHNACLAGNNFSDCYDKAAHPMAAISLQCFGIPQPAINLLLKTMKTMRFFFALGLENQKHHMEGPMNSNLLDTDKEMQLQVLVSQL